MKTQEIVLAAIVVTACACLFAVFFAPFLGVTMPDENKAFIFNLVLLFVGGGVGGAIVWTQGRTEKAELRTRLARAETAAYAAQNDLALREKAQAE